MNKKDEMEIDILYKEYLPLIRSMISQYGKGYHDQSALENESYIAVWEAYKHFEPEKGNTFGTYLKFWLKKYLLEYLKNNAPVDTTFQTNRIRDKVQVEHKDNPLNSEVLKNIPENEKQCLILLYNEQKTLSEIAEIMHITREQARQLKEKALRRLRAQLG